VPKQIDHVVEVTRSRALRERADFFTEDLFVRVTPSRDTPFGQVAIGMSDGSIDGVQAGANASYCRCRQASAWSRQSLTSYLQ
jgi:hypothetical protein